MRHPRKSVARASKSGNATNASSVPTDALRERAAERAVREIKQQGTPRNTLRAVDTAERYWTAWYRLRYRSDSLPMPVPTDVIIQFIVDHGARASPDAGEPTCELPPKVDRALIALGVKKEGLLSFETIRQRVSLIGRLNKPHLNGLPNPASDTEVRDLLVALRSAYAQLRETHPQGVKAQRPERDEFVLRGGQKPALTAGPLKQLLAVLEKDLDDESSAWRYRRALRDRAMLLFAFGTGGRRRAEVTSATVERLKREKNGDYTYTLGATKTDKGKKDDDQLKKKPLKRDAARAMEAWLEEAQLRSGPIFRRITKRGRITGQALTPASVRNLVTRLARTAGLADEGYSAHSLRSGYITEAAHSGVALADAMVLSGHKSVQTALRYYRMQNPHDSPGANLADGLTQIRLKKRRR